MKTNTELVSYAKSKLGKSYVYGTFGHVLTQSLLDYLAKRNTNGIYTSSYIAKCKKLIGQQCFDCIGLIKAYVWGVENDYTTEAKAGSAEYNAAQDKSADGTLAACTEKGNINTIPELPGILVFKSGHVGIYIGGGQVIEARGVDYGVVQTKLSARGWTSWGKCPWIEYVEEKKEGNTVKYYQLFKENMNLRSGAGKNYGVIGVVPKGATIEVSQASGSWGKTTYNGKTGWCSISPTYAKEISAPVVTAPIKVVAPATVTKAQYDQVVKEKAVLQQQLAALTADKTNLQQQVATLVLERDGYKDKLAQSKVLAVQIGKI